MSRTGIYANAKLDFASGTLSFLSGSLKAVPVTAGYVQDFDNDQHLSQILAGNRAATPVLVTGKTLSKVQDTVVFRADAVSFPSVPAGAPIVGLVLYEDTGTESTSRLVAYFDYFTNLPLTPTGVNVTFNWPVYAILVILEGVLGGPQGVPGTDVAALEDVTAYTRATTSNDGWQTAGTINPITFANGAYELEMIAIGDAGLDLGADLPSTITIRREYSFQARGGGILGLSSGLLLKRVITPAASDPVDADARITTLDGGDTISVQVAGEASTKIDWKVFVIRRYVTAASGGHGWGTP